MSVAVLKGLLALAAACVLRPHSVGHLIDLVAALLGVTLVTTSFLLRYLGRGSRRSDLGGR